MTLNAAELHDAIRGIAINGRGHRAVVVVQTDGHQLHIDHVEVHPVLGSTRRPRDLKVVLLTGQPTTL